MKANHRMILIVAGLVLMAGVAASMVLPASKKLRRHAQHMFTVNSPPAVVLMVGTNLTSIRRGIVW
jgi:hypothetical protein